MSRRDHLPDDQWLEDALRRALDEEAASVEVGEDGLDRILERTGTHEWRWGRIALAAAAVTVASGLGVAALVGGDEPVVVSPGPAAPTESVPTPTPTPTEPAPTTTPDATPAPDDGATATPAPAPPPREARIQEERQGTGRALAPRARARRWPAPARNERAHRLTRQPASDLRAWRAVSNSSTDTWA